MAFEYQLFFRKRISILLIGVLILLLIALYFLFNRYKSVVPIKIGILFSLTGPESFNQKYLVDSVQFFINDINIKGGVLGRPLELIIADGKSDLKVFEHETERLILFDKVSLIIGCINSDCLNVVTPIVEKYHSLLFFPSSYEGFEKSSQVIYFGSVPNQQILPGMSWAIKNLGPKVYFIGNKNSLSMSVRQVVRDLVVAHSGELVGESLIDSLDFNDTQAIIKELTLQKPNFILNCLEGDLALNLFEKIAQSGLQSLPILTRHANEFNLKKIANIKLENHFFLMSYINNINLPSNQQWLQKINNEPTGAELYKSGFITEEVESIYTALSIWFEVVNEKKTVDPIQINADKLNHFTFNGPSGVVSVDTRTRHVWRISRISKLEPEGKLQLVSESPYPIKPSPWPVHRSKEDWEKLKLMWKTAYSSNRKYEDKR